MSTCAVLIDSRPEYLNGDGEVTSLLFVPLGVGTLLDHLISLFDSSSARPPLILAPPGADAAYESRVRAARPEVEVVRDWHALKDALSALEPSDTLLIVDPRCLPVKGYDFDVLSAKGSDPRWVTHYVAFERSAGSGTKEFVSVDADGHVRRIQRYYDSVTWPLISGIAASRLPVSSGILSEQVTATSLWELRSRLTLSGVPSHDVAMRGGVYDLNDEGGYLAAAEDSVLRASAAARDRARARPLLVGSGHALHPTARIVGPVVIHERATIDAHAQLVGPSLIGAGARVGKGAIVAQSAIGPGCEVNALTVIRHRAVLENAAVDSARPASAVHQPLQRSSAVASAESQPDVDRTLYFLIKRVFDIVVATVGLVVLSPLLALIAVLVRLDSRGSVLYGHERESPDRGVFRCWKFRTMYVGAEAQQRKLASGNLMDGPQFKMARDPRITRVGRVLRATNLDEIPQLFNVLRGEMSLVGPRPSPFRENQFCVPWREGRLSVKSGMTGLWQVCRHDREISDFDQWIEYDLMYVRYASLLLDLKILLATFVTMGGKKHVPLSWMVRVPRTAIPASRMVS